jgi:hypothetical protein
MALVKTQYHFQSMDRNISFKFEIPENVTDSVIRERFYSKIHSKSENLVMALCEPGDGKPSANKAARDLKLRKMPLLWRLPHWMITNRNSLDLPHHTNGQFIRAVDFPLEKLARKITIYCYPQNTTSGNYIRTICQTLPALREKEITFKDIPPSDDRMIELYLEKDAYQIHFTPWHQVDSDRYLAIAELPGPHFDITALLMPEEWSTDQRSVDNIYNSILLQLNSILISLADTQGERREIENYINSSFNDVTALFSNPKLPKLRNIAEFISSYIKRGCYFPYLVVEKALRSELSRMIRKQLDIVRDSAAAGIEYELSLLLGSRTDWLDLSFKERAEIQTTWHQVNKTEEESSSGNQTERVRLSHKLTHRHNKENDHSFDSFINSIKVQTENGANPMALIRLNNRSRSLICSSTTDKSEMPPNECKGGIVELPGDWSVYEKTPCFTCTVCGFPGALLIAGATRLAGPILKKLNHSATESENKDGGNIGAQAKIVSPIKYQSAEYGDKAYNPSFGTILCWENIQEVFHIFRDELREPDKTMPHPCYLLLATNWNWKDTGEILLAIFWRGTTEKRMSGSGSSSGLGDATNRLSYWAESQTKAGRPVSWCGFWHADESKTEWTRLFPKTLVPISDEGESFNPSKLNIWGKAKEIIDEGKYVFAYVAVFECPAIGK